MTESNGWIIALSVMLALGSMRCARSHDPHPASDAGPGVDASPPECASKLDLLLLLDNSTR